MDRELIINREWAKQGKCSECQHQPSISDIDIEQASMNYDWKRFEIPCPANPDHHGIRIHWRHTDE